MVSVLALTSANALPGSFPNTTVPSPPKVWLPEKAIVPIQVLVGLPTCSVPLIVKPCSTVSPADSTLLPTSQFPLTVTPSNVPLCTTKEAPLVPWRTVA